MRTEDNSLEKAQVATATEWTAERKDLVRRMYAPQCTEDEFSVFLSLAMKLNLDPSKGELYAVKYGTRPASIFVGKNGYLAWASRHPQYDGHNVEAIMSEGQCIGAKATVWRKDRAHPITVEVDMDEYSTGKSLWAKPSQGGKPKTMIKKVALSQAIRESFPGDWNGTYDESETWEDRTVDAKVMPVPTEGPPVTQDEKAASLAQAFMQQAEKEGWLSYVPEEDLAKIGDRTRKQLQAMADSARELMASDAAEEHEESIMQMALESDQGE